MITNDLETTYVRAARGVNTESAPFQQESAIQDTNFSEYALECPPRVVYPRHPRFPRRANSAANPKHNNQSEPGSGMVIN